MAQFEKGQSGNPGGKPRTRELRALCREYTERAVKRLGELLDYEKAPTVQLAAARELLDRAWGKPLQATEVQVDDKRSAEPMTPAEVQLALRDLLANAERAMGLEVLEDADNSERVKRIMRAPGHLPPALYAALQTSETLQ